MTKLLKKIGGLIAGERALVLFWPRLPNAAKEAKHYRLAPRSAAQYRLQRRLRLIFFFFSPGLKELSKGSMLDRQLSGGATRGRSRISLQAW